MRGKESLKRIFLASEEYRARVTEEQERAAVESARAFSAPFFVWLNDRVKVEFAYNTGLHEATKGMIDVARAQKFGLEINDRLAVTNGHVYIGIQGKPGISPISHVRYIWDITANRALQFSVDNKVDTPEARQALLPAFYSGFMLPTMPQHHADAMAAFPNRSQYARTTVTKEGRSVTLTESYKQGTSTTHYRYIGEGVVQDTRYHTWMMTSSSHRGPEATLSDDWSPGGGGPKRNVDEDHGGIKPVWDPV